MLTAMRDQTLLEPAGRDRLAALERQVISEWTSARLALSTVIPDWSARIKTGIFAGSERSQQKKLAQEAVALIERREDHLGREGETSPPTVSEDQLHPWVWSAAGDVVVGPLPPRGQRRRRSRRSRHNQAQGADQFHRTEQCRLHRGIRRILTQGRQPSAAPAPLRRAPGRPPPRRHPRSPPAGTRPAPASRRRSQLRRRPPHPPHPRSPLPPAHRGTGRSPPPAHTTNHPQPVTGSGVRYAAGPSGPPRCRNAR